MRSSTIQEIKQELVTHNPADLVALCLRLARFKKENKELLTYLLFEAQDEEGYIKSVKQEIEELFGGINLSHLYFAKKRSGRLCGSSISIHGTAVTNKPRWSCASFFCSNLKHLASHSGESPFWQISMTGN